MQTTPVTSQQFSESVLAVPPLARNKDDRICRDNNQRIIQFIERGGVSMLLYGGNANFYHIRLSEYADALQMLQDVAADDTLVIPSVGPSYGLMMDQADVIRETEFPTVMVLPTTAVMTEPGLMTGFRRFVEAIDRPAVLYIKEDGYISPQGAADLVNDGLVSFIKYAIVRDDPSEDDYLDELIDKVDPGRICSGIGEQPALVHMTRFRCSGYTSGCVCVNPALSQSMLASIIDRDYDTAEDIRRMFLPLEDLRNELNPIRVLHEAVRLADIGDTGPHLPLLSGLSDRAEDRIRKAAVALKNLNAPAAGKA